jgi:hypothetical protein
MWRGGGRLQNDPRKLSTIVGLSEKRWLEIADDVVLLFHSAGGTLTHKRMLRELEHYADISAKRASAGQAGGKAKANASGLPPKPESEPKPDSHPSGESRAPLVDVGELQRQTAEAMEAAGEALASVATHPGVAMIAPLRALLAGDNPCDWSADVLPAIRSAAAWHMQKGGAASMKTWTAVARFATENRDQRLAGPGTGKTNGSVTSNDRDANLARAYASPGERPQLHR